MSTPSLVNIESADTDVRVQDDERYSTDADVRIADVEGYSTDVDVQITDTDGRLCYQSNGKQIEADNDDYKIDKLFYRICFFCLILGVNFNKDRKIYQKVMSFILIGVNVMINGYFALHMCYITYKKPLTPDSLATTLMVITWTLQATASMIFLAYWQYTEQSKAVIHNIYRANRGIGIHRYRMRLISIVRCFYFVLVSIVTYKILLMIETWNGKIDAFIDKSIFEMFGDPRLFLIFQLSNLYTVLCWTVALFLFSLVVHASNYEFRYYNEQVRQIKYEIEEDADDLTCGYLLKLMMVHGRLIHCVKLMDRMFNRYAFVMIASIIPTTTFALFMVFRRTEKDVATRCFELLFACPLIFFSIFSFFALTNGPSQLHETIYATKSALCANTNIWFPYRPNVYHSALAFVCHLDQTNLGVSIWGFAIVSKPLVLTSLSVMVTCLALFLQFGDCSNARFSYSLYAHAT